MHYYNYLGTRGCLFTHWIEAIKLSYLLRSANGIQCYCSSRWDNLGKGLCRFLLAVFPRNLKCQRMKQSGKKLKEASLGIKQSNEIKWLE